MMYKLLCRIGIHKPIKGFTFSFTDVISGKPVYRGRCACGRQWLTELPPSVSGFKVSVGREDEGDE